MSRQQYRLTPSRSSNSQGNGWTVAAALAAIAFSGAIYYRHSQYSEAAKDYPAGFLATSEITDVHMLDYERQAVSNLSNSEVENLINLGFERTSYSSYLWRDTYKLFRHGRTNIDEIAKAFEKIEPGATKLKIEEINFHKVSYRKGTKVRYTVIEDGPAKLLSIRFYIEGE